MVAMAAVSCSIDSPDSISSKNGLSFDVVLENNLGTRSGDIELKSENGETPLILQRIIDTRSVQVDNEATFKTVFNGSFEVEGSEGGANTVFHSTAAYNSTSGLWDLQNSTYVWKPFKTLEVVALAADSDFDNTAFFRGINYNGTPKSSGSFDYTVPANLSPKDLLIGYYKGEASTGTVSLKFNHPLTSLQFKVGDMPAGATLTVNSISLVDIDKSAHCIVAFDSNETTYSWNNYSGKVSYTKTFDNPQAMTPGTVFVDGDDTFIVLPRKFPHNTEAKIVVNVTEFNRTYDVYASLADQEWKPGETNVYAITYQGQKSAILNNGPDVNLAIKSMANVNQIRHIRFVVDTNVTSGVEVQEPTRWPIYLSWDNPSKTVTIATSDLTIHTGSDASHLFDGLTALESIINLDLLNTSNCVNMAAMFASCSSLTSVDLSNFETDKVTNMSLMFAYLRSMTSLDLSSFRTDSVTGMGGMFRGTSESVRNSLTSITFGEHFQIPNNKSFAYTFAFTNLSGALDLSMFRCTNLQDLEYMFQSSPSITSVDLSGLGENSTIFFAPSVFFHTGVTSINFGPEITFAGLRAADTDGFFSTNTSRIVVTCNQAAENKLKTFGGYSASKVTFQRPTVTP